ncbi:hypothetical protein AQUCO_02200170v1 [Aquilegia coerulea]|uniref:F-box domain-containing protein n=1 Tax=Aquilegia coerulea TaxID=218851 RepID=A0A2G5DDE5_AQUCA|nr:hypothetical protein AQUCO_02200170v1 [Aquilegia coerulea]
MAETRNWVDLPQDVTTMIFTKVGAVDILSNVQFVCSFWQTVSKDPQLFHSINIHQPDCVESLIEDDDQLVKGRRLYKLAEVAVDKSHGQLVEVCLENFDDIQLLHYMADKSGLIKRLRLRFSRCFCRIKVNRIIRKLPLLEELELWQKNCSRESIKAIGRSWSSGEVGSGEDVLAIADSMPQLHCLSISGFHISNKELQAILDGCPNLEYLYIKRCYCNIKKDIVKICRDKIKYLSITDMMKRIRVQTVW